MENQSGGTDVVVSSEFLHNMAHNITESTIYLMGGSFILGSLVTIMLLLILDFMRQRSANEENDK